MNKKQLARLENVKKLIIERQKELIEEGVQFKDIKKGDLVDRLEAIEHNSRLRVKDAYYNRLLREHKKLSDLQIASIRNAPERRYEEPEPEPYCALGLKVNFERRGEGIMRLDSCMSPEPKDSSDYELYCKFCDYNPDNQ